MTVIFENVRIPLGASGKSLAGRIYRDGALCNYDEVIVSTHGRYGPDPAKTGGIDGLMALNQYCAEQGKLVLFVVRRGYPGSDGEDAEGLRTPEENALAGVKDISAAVDYIQALSDGRFQINKRRIFVLGQSQGGWIALAAASARLDGVVATVNLSGAINYYPDSSNPTEPAKLDRAYYDRLRLSAERLGVPPRVRTIWIYAENDHNCDKYDEFPRRMFSSFSSQDVGDSLHVLPPYRENGHSVCNEPSLFVKFIV